MNGAITLSADTKSTFVQARCVGGGTLVNNSVALKPEGFWWDDVIVGRWSWRGANLDFPRLHDSYDAIMALINVQPVMERTTPVMPHVLRRGFEKIGMEPKVATANVLECIGCGRCNAGCAYGAKQSMIETTIPAVVAGGGLLVPNAHVLNLVLDGSPGNQICRGARVRTRDGDEITVEADKVVLAAGAFASTKILRRSGFAGMNPGVRTVGKQFSGNMGTPLFAEFDASLRGWDGIQIAYLAEMPEQRLVIETAFAPPPGFGLQAPQWGQSFMDALVKFDHLGVACPVLGTSAYGDIVKDLSPSGYSINFAMNDDDWYRLSLGLKRSAEAMFAAGAHTIYSTRFDAATLTDPAAINHYFAGTGPLQYLKMTTAHLQGGNVISDDPNQGVVDANMKVYGIDRLWITDASVMPSPITLNVQLTIMALAHYAAPGIAAA
jgi:choline dehydrogenase-like flavoprotein